MWERRSVVLVGLLAGLGCPTACGDGEAGFPATGGGAGRGTAAEAGDAGRGAGRAGSGGADGGSGGSEGGGEAGAPPRAGAAGEAGEAPIPPELSFGREQVAGDDWIEALWGESADDVYAAGDEGRLLHFAGGSWQLENTETTASLTGIWGSEAGAVYVAVDDNFVLRSGGTRAWTREPLPAGYKLLDIWGSGAEDVYALTGDGVFRSNGGGEWELEAVTPARVPLTAIWGSSASDVYVSAAFANTPTVFHSSGDGEWEEQGGPEASLAALSGVSEGRLFGVGGTTVYAQRHDGTWRAELTLEGGDSVNALFVLSSEAVYACSKRGLLFRSNGAGAWSEGQPVNPNGISPPCRALWASGTDNVYAATERGLFRGVLD